MGNNKQETILNLLFNLWAHIQPRRKIQLIFLIFLMLGVSLAEIISIGAVLPFLGALTSPEKVFNLEMLNPIFLKMGFVNPNELLFPMTVFFISSVLLAGGMRLILLWTQTHFAYAIGADLSISVYRYALYLPYIEQVTKNSSEFIASISHKTHLVVTQVLMPALLIFSATIILLAIFTAVLLIEPFAALIIIFGFGGIYSFVLFITKKKLYKDSESINIKSNLLIKSLQEGFGGIRDVLIDGTQEIYCKIFRNYDLPLRKAQAGLAIIGQTPRFIVEALGITILAILAFSLSSNLDNLTNAIPILGVFALAAQRLLPILQQIYSSWSSIFGCSALLRDILYYLNQGLPDYANLKKIKPIKFLRNIKFEEINFSYDEQGPLIIKDFNYEIKKGSKIGIIGTTGSGKSTLIDIIMGLLAPKKGNFYIDDTKITIDNYRSWQSHIAHVPQNIFLADTTVLENIAFGVLEDQIDYELVYQCAKKAKISDSINSWKNKYETVVGERGVRLSGGQRQRIGIARALYKKTDVIIFDEATSALDNDTESAVMKEIINLDNDITILIIAHRLSTLKNCSQLIEIADGKVKRFGSYKDIVSNNA
jgi:ATP-binding cassette, subfamily B, bacterial PglK